MNLKVLLNKNTCIHCLTREEGNEIERQIVKMVGKGDYKEGIWDIEKGDTCYLIEKGNIRILPLNAAKERCWRIYSAADFIGLKKQFIHSVVMMDYLMGGMIGANGIIGEIENETMKLAREVSKYKSLIDDCLEGEEKLYRYDDDDLDYLISYERKEEREMDNKMVAEQYENYPF